MRHKYAALFALLCLLLTACVPADADTDPAHTGSASPSNEEKAPYSSADVQTLLGSGIFSEEPEQLDGDIACELFGVSADAVRECAVYMPTSTNAEVLALFVLNDGEDVQAVQTLCRKWLDNQIDSYRSYGPEHVPKLEGATLAVRENSVLLAVGADPGATRTAVDGLDG